MNSDLDYLNTSFFLNESQAFTENFLNRDVSPNYTHTHVHHHHSPSWGWGGGWHRPVCYVPSYSIFSSPSGSFSSEESRKKEQRTFIAVAAMVVSSVAVYFAGQNYSEWTQASRGIDKVEKKFQQTIPEIEQSHPALRSKMLEVYEKEVALLKHIESNAKTGFLWQAMLGTSGVAIAMGGMIAAAPAALFTGGLVGGGISLTAMLWRAGIRSVDASLKTEAQELATSVREATQILHAVQAF